LISVRIPEQFGSLVALAELYIFTHYDKNKASFKEYLEASTAWLPQQFNVFKPKDWFVSLLPQLFKPTASAIFNSRTYPEIMPIVPEYLKRLEPRDQYDKYSTSVAKFIGNLMNWSPKKIDFWIRAQFGSLAGMFVGKLPSNPIHKQEDKWAMSGRAYNNFYEKKLHINQEYKRLMKNPLMNIDELFQVKSKKKIYQNVNETLKDMRKIDKSDHDLPENMRVKAFNMLLSLDRDEDLNKLLNKVIDLKVEVGNFRIKHEIY